MQICRLQKWCLFLLCLLSVLCVRISTLQAHEDQMNKCFTYYEQILDIQEQRQAFQQGIDYLLHLFAQGKVDKKQLDMTLAMWHTVESKLRDEVTQLYDTAYSEGCFEIQPY